MATNWDRRDFVKFMVGTGIGLSLPSFAARSGEPVQALLATAPAYTGWKDLYRKQWTWDKVVRGTHIINCWYQAHCAWDVYVKDGLVFREEQAAEYERLNDELPDYNPRGCQKGGCFSERMYDPSRVTHPLRRAGERGQNKWERVGWDEALTDIADTWLDVATEQGTDRVIWDIGPADDYAQNAAAFARLSALTQSVLLDMNGEIGDAHRGTFETFGKISFESSADDYFYSDLILFWAGNPLYTQIPQAHFFTEAKYRGARIISIAPDYNASAIKADLWIPIKPGTDAALALGVAKLLVEQGRIDPGFIREQTDLVLLVRDDTRHFLSEADLQEGGRSDRFYAWDETSGSVQAMPWKSLSLGDLQPALEASSRVILKDGSEVAVSTVFSRLRPLLAEYTAEAVGEICGIQAAMVRRLAEEIGSARRMRNVTQSTHSKLYHGNLHTRAIALVFALTGQFGRKGAGLSGFPMMALEGLERFMIARNLEELAAPPPELAAMMSQRLAAGDTLEQITNDLGTAIMSPGALPLAVPIFTSGTLFWHIHAGVGALSEQAPDWNRALQRSVKDHVAEALEKKWQFCLPKPGNDPRIMFSVMSNPLRRIRGNQKIVEVLLPKLAKYVVLDFRMSSSARYADYVLPVSTWYERTNIKWVTPLSPYLTVANAATPPRGESKSDFEVIYLLAKKIQERARARGIGVVATPQGLESDFGNLYQRISFDGAFTEHDGEKVVKYIFEHGGLFGDTSWEQAKDKGFVRYTRVSNDMASIGNQTDIPSNDSIVALSNHVQKKVPYPTTTRRIQFYLDHPLYHEYGEVLPRHKAPPSIGGEYPLILSGGKSRWSIHSTWRDSRMMMRLHRPEPYVVMAAADAAARGITEMAWVRVHNDVGSFRARAAVSPSMQPGQAMIYNGWERHQFQGDGDMNSVSPSPLNPVELAGGAGQHLRPFFIQGQSSMFDRETRVDIEPWNDAP
ncbi:MAG TPA: molybdopterin-dependent oxidoreductase [Gammaproteobacteria bacterium]|nr:molybdopterin-dependent oxidoreductase [Gammaproteobacteria bacterium]